MPKTVTLEDGTEIELSDEIVSEIKTEATEEYLADHPDTSDELERLRAEAEEAKRLATEAQEKLDNNTVGANFAELRKAKEDLEKRAKETVDKFSKQIEEVKGLVVNKTKNEAFGSLAGDDEEMRKKMEHHYSTTLSALPATTDEEIKARAEMAYRLSRPEVALPVLGYGQISSSGGTARPTIDKDEDLSLAKSVLGEDKIKTLKVDVNAMRERRTQ